MNTNETETKTEETETYSPELLALAKHLSAKPEDISEESYDLFGLPVFSYEGEEYAVGSDDAAESAAKEYIRDSVWAFRPEFILSHSKVDMAPEDLGAIQAKMCEGANRMVMSLIDDFDDFVIEAIAADGRGHFLASYDGDEIEIRNDVGTGHAQYWYAYRIN